MNHDDRYLGWFLGPKAENAQLLENALLTVMRDYAHWRRNYFPGDKMLVSQKLQRLLADESDILTQHVDEMMADLRRNFPFYSPRYIAHQLSDTSIPAILGYFAGMLFNPNNVTPEAAPVTVDWEIEACNEILRMLGYTPPPQPSDTHFDERIRHEFGWAHLTLGGTTANIEALWLARNVRYFPLAIHNVAIQNDLPINVKVADPDNRDRTVDQDIRSLSERDVLLLKPNESIYLLAKFVDAIRRKQDISVEEAGDAAVQLLNKSKYALSNGLAAMQKYPPVIFVSGAAHYSIRKAADLLGIGRNNVIAVKMNSLFRMDVTDLEAKVRAQLLRGRIPLAVVAIAGTTEEGAVDPVHEICDLRTELERDLRASFWLHIDAAWGGFFRSLFQDKDALLAKLSQVLALKYDGDIVQWNEALLAKLETTLEDTPDADHARRELIPYRERLRQCAALDDADSYIKALRELVKILRISLPTLPLSFEQLSAALGSLTFEDRTEIINTFVQDEVSLTWGEHHKDVKIMWGAKDVCSAFLSFNKADSITIDPHKMGYVPYPSGIVAFRNDRVRHFILEKTPYISSSKQRPLIHMPPKHPNTSSSRDHETKVVIEAFAPFTLEGSKPGAAASALWLSTRTVPLTMHGHGAVAKASLLAARELHEWLVHWNKLAQLGSDVDYEFVPVILRPPDTNIVVFTVKKRTSSSLASLNEVTMAVYERFTIQAELGERQYSYSQPFFLSKTELSEPNYSYDMLCNLFKRCQLRNVRRQYVQEGLVVLRATVMSPYIYPLRKDGIQNIMMEFMKELSRAAKAAVSLATQ